MNSPNFDPRGVRWIAFDAVGTLIHPAPSAAAVYHGVGLRHGSRLAAEEVARRFVDVFARSAQCPDLDCGCVEAEEPCHTCEVRERLRWQRIVELVLDDLLSPGECFEELFVHFGQPDNWACFSEVGSALRALRRAGYRLAVCSNFDARLNAVMDGTPQLAPIELRVLSSDVKYRKPSGRFFEALTRAANCAASEILFIGDDPANDVAAAEAAGIWAWQIERGVGPRQNQPFQSLDQLVARLVDR